MICYFCLYGSKPGIDLLCSCVTTLTRNGRVEVVVARIEALIEALEGGVCLKKLFIKVQWEDSEPVPGSFDEVLRALEGFRLGKGTEVAAEYRLFTS